MYELYLYVLIGKSTIVHEIVKRIDVRYKKYSVQVAITAPTGTAAASINGKTIHSLLILPMKSKEFKKLDDLSTRNF